MPSLGVADTARALAGLRAALGLGVQTAATQLLEEPRLEVKATLAAHLLENTRAIRELDTRIEELGGADRTTPATAADLLQRIDPLTDEATLRVLTSIAHRERRQQDEIDPRLHPPRERSPELDDAPHVERAEQAVRALLQRDESAFRADMARIAADCLRHAIIDGREGAQEHIAAEQAVHARIRARWKL